MVGELEALLMNVRVALAAPVALGVKVTVNGADWPARIVAGRVMPESTNWPLELLADETVTDELVAFRLPFSEEPEPTLTLPKASVAGETESWPGAAPMPESATLRGEFEPFDTIARVPLAEPDAVGVKVAVKVTL